jgi:hypothetical protein
LIACGGDEYYHGTRKHPPLGRGKEGLNLVKLQTLRVKIMKGENRLATFSRVAKGGKTGDFVLAT